MITLQLGAEPLFGPIPWHNVTVTSALSLTYCLTCPDALILEVRSNKEEVPYSTPEEPVKEEKDALHLALLSDNLLK